MTAYWISIYREIRDEAKVAAYAELAGPALRGAGGTFVARGLPEQTYEGGEKTRTVLIEFDSVEAARAAHDSPAYQEALDRARRWRAARHADRARRALSRPRGPEASLRAELLAVAGPRAGPPRSAEPGRTASASSHDQLRRG